MLRLRVASAAVLIPVLLVALILGVPWLIALIVVIAAVAAWEAAELVGRAGLAVDRVLAVVLGTVAVLAIGTLGSDRHIWAALVTGAVLVTGIAALRLGDPRQGLMTWAGSLFVVAYVSLLGAALRILAEPIPIPESAALSTVLDPRRVWLLILVLGVWSYDTSAYVVGRAVPRGRFMSHISPAKTWSGVVGGVVGCIVVTTVLVGAAGQDVLPGVILGAVVAVGAQAGDLAESMLKRAAGAKDSGTLIPGHGGVLDRVDSFLFAAPAFYLVLVLLPFWSRPGG